MMSSFGSWCWPRLGQAALVVALGGCASVPEGYQDPVDPWEGYNRAVTRFNDDFDAAIYRPVARGYKKVAPRFVDHGVTNFFGNQRDFISALNNLLQLKLDRAASDVGRVAINSTVGLLGFIDVATHMDLPKRNEDFGQTLAFWGVDSGPFFVLPFLGPSTVRDGLSVPVDWYLFDPVFRDKELEVTLSLLAIRYTDLRADLITATDIIDETAPDKYAYIRDAFLQRREYLIHDGNPPEEDFSEDELFKDENLFEDDLDLEKDLKK